MDDEGSTEEQGRLSRRLLGQLKLLGVLAVAIAVIGFGSGWLLGQTRGATAARRLLAGRVDVEAAAGEAGDPAAPTSGEPGGEPQCGVRDRPVPPREQLALLHLGGAWIQYRPDDVTGAEVDELEEVVRGSESHVALAPNPRINAPVVATATERRLRLDEVDAGLLRAFVAGYVAPTGAPGDCPIG